MNIACGYRFRYAVWLQSMRIDRFKGFRNRVMPQIARLPLIASSRAGRRMGASGSLCGLVLLIISPGFGCRQQIVQATDRQVYQIIADRQQASTGIVAEGSIGPEVDAPKADARMYDFNPRPVSAGVPEAFQPRATSAESERLSVDEPSHEVAPPSTSSLIPMDLYTPEQMVEVTVFGLRDALAYAMRQSPELQDAKEQLYLSALDLSLERHLWTPQFVAEVEARYDRFADPDEEVPIDAARTALDRSMSTVSEVAVSQRLPFGGDVTARAIHTMVRDVADRVTEGDSGDVILAANLPLLRGAGRAAYESRYTAERGLIYAVRRYERFRRSFVVSIAGDFFDLQQQKASIANTHQSYVNRRLDWDRAYFVHRMGRSQSIAEAPRARANFRDAEARLVNVKEIYATALDRFKIRVGMPVDEWLDVIGQDLDEGSREVDRLLADVTEQEAVAVALDNRLDLLNSADQVDDARRDVDVAGNQVLPDLDLTGSVTYSSDSEHRSPARLREDRDTWQGGLSFRIDDRKSERNAFRAALVGLRKAERDHGQFADTVRADVRRTLRRILQQDNLRRIQEANVAENEVRYFGARAQYELGRSTNQDVVDAQNDLLTAQNSLAAAVAEYRVSILEFRRDTGTLRVTDGGRWGLDPRADEGAAPDGDGAGP
jgi:outer membrane protein TolC